MSGFIKRENVLNLLPKSRFFYSYLNVFDGLDIAALIVCALTVNNAIMMAARAENRYMKKLLSIL